MGQGVLHDHLSPFTEVHWEGLSTRPLLVEDCVVAELKAVEKLLRLHDAQLIAYLKLSGMNVGLLINFCVPQLRLGIRRLVHNYHEE
jgi:GxxExxY protein